MLDLRVPLRSSTLKDSFKAVALTLGLLTPAAPVDVQGATAEAYLPGSPVFENGVLQADRAKISPGDFNVGRTGAATYNIPVMVAPGTAGMQPNLALTYNSQAGNGLVGVGWRLGGLSAITRCSRTIAQDGQNGPITYTSTDRFCMGGLRLVAVVGIYGANGTEYRTEKDTFVKITSHGTAGTGPDHFLVKTKEGRTLEYGKTPDSQIQGTGSEVRVWALNQVQDTSGNYMTISYLESEGDFRPNEIEYTLNAGLAASRRVLFEYETRDDVPKRFVGGGAIETAYRLTNIKSFAQVSGAEKLVRDYRLVYDTAATFTGRSRLLTISECVESGSCHDAFSIDWTATGTPTGIFDVKDQSVALESVLNGDFNGDGRVDFVKLVGTSFTAFLSVCDANCTPAYQSLSWGTVDEWDPTKVWRGDFDGDGLTDLLTNLNNTFYTYFSTGAAFDTEVSGGSGSNEVMQDFAWTGDFNGDGRSDIVTLKDTDKIITHVSLGDGTYTEYTWTRPAGAKWSDNKDHFWVGDLNGDRMADLISFKDGELQIYRN